MSNSTRFIGLSAVVTGAASGIGRATAIRLAKEGASLVLADIDAPGLGATVERVGSENPGGIECVTFDAADPDSCRRMIDAAHERLGRIDALLNIAGILVTGAFDALAESDIERAIRINLLSLFYLCQQALPALTESRGNIVNVASTAALRGVPYASAYSASKYGVVGLTKSMAAEFIPRGVRVNAVCPGAIDTPMLAWVGSSSDDKPSSQRPMAMGTPEEVAAAIAFLASGEAHYITGSVLAVDGGLTA